MERQLLFLLDYDLGMQESDLLEHFAPFLRRPVASTSRSSTRAPAPAPIDTQHHYPTTPTRRPSLAPACDAGLLTPSPSPRRASHHQPQPAPRSAAPRVSPTGSTSSGGDTLSDDLHSGSDSDSMDVDPRSASSRPKRTSPLARSSSRLTPPRRASKHLPSSAPLTPTDEHSYPLPAYPTPPSSDRRPSYPEPALRTQRSGSFLRMTFEAGKGMLSGGLSHRQSKGNLKEQGQDGMVLV